MHGVFKRNDRRFVREIVLLRQSLYLFQLRLLVRIRRERGLVRLVGSLPQPGAESERIVIERSQLYLPVAPRSRAVDLVVAYANGNASQPLMPVITANIRAKISLGLVILDVFNTVLNEEWLLESLQLKLIPVAIQFREHGLQNRVFFRIGARLLRGNGNARNKDRSSERERNSEAISVHQFPFPAVRF